MAPCRRVMMQVALGLLLSSLVHDTMAYRKRVKSHDMAEKFSSTDSKSDANVTHESMSALLASEHEDTPKECSAHTACADLSGDCCPHPDGRMLECCNQPDKETKFIDWILDNMIQIDAAKAEEKLRATAGILLPADQETVVMAFKVGKDRTYLTNRRILLRPQGWLFSRSTTYESIPYSSILKYDMQTGGVFPDMDAEFGFWTKMTSLRNEIDSSSIRATPSYFQLNFRKGTENADIFQIMKFINSQMLGADKESASLLEDNTAASNPFVDLWHWVSNNAKEVGDVAKIEKRFKVDFPVLQNDEFIEKAFKVGGLTTLLTNKRFVRIKVKGIFGKKVSYESWPWQSVQAWSVQSKGYIDDDCEMTIWTNIPDSSMRKFSQDLRGFGEGSPDVLQIQEIFQKYILGTDASPRVLGLGSDIAEKGDVVVGEQLLGKPWELLLWLAGGKGQDVALQLDAGLAEARLRAATARAPLLQKNEHVEFSFKGIRGDVVYMTTKRIVTANVKKILFGWIVDKIEYMSYPFKSIGAFDVQVAALLDWSHHLTLYMDITPPPPFYVCADTSGNVKAQKDEKKDEKGKKSTTGGGSSALLEAGTQNLKPTLETKYSTNAEGKPQVCTPVPVPGKSMIDFSLWRGSGIFDLQKLLYKRVGPASLESQPDGDGPVDNSTKTGASILTPVGLYHWLDGNAKEINPAKAQKVVEDAGPILQPGESVQKAFTTWRDLTLFTSTRLLIVDVQRFLVWKRVLYRTVPYSSIHGFGIRAAGTFDLDAEMVFYTGLPWLPKIQQDLRRKTCSIPEVQGFLADKIIGTKSPSLLEETGVAVNDESDLGIGDFLDWLGKNYGKINVQSAMAQLSTKPPVLLNGEKISLGYRIRKDMVLFTTHRILIVDVSDLDILSYKVEYRTVPYASILGFSVHTASWKFDRDEEVILHTNMPDMKKLETDIQVDGKDIFDIQMMISTKVLG